MSDERPVPDPRSHRDRLAAAQRAATTTAEDIVVCIPDGVERLNRIPTELIPL